MELKPGDIENLTAELAEYHQLFAPLFWRREQREWCLEYLRGLLSKRARNKSVEAMVLELPGGNVRALQQSVGPGRGMMRLC